MKGKFQFRFVAGFLLATGSLVIAALIVRADSAQHRRTQAEISNGLVISLAAQDVVRSVDDAETQRDLYVRSGDEKDRQEFEKSEGKISNALAGNGQLFTIYSDSTQIPGVSEVADQIAGMQIDTTNHLIYFVTNKNINTGNNEVSVFEKIGYSTTALNANINETPTVLNSSLYIESNNFGENGGVGS